MSKLTLLPKSPKILSAALLASAIMAGPLAAVDYIVSSDQDLNGPIILFDNEQFILTNDAILTGLNDASILSNRTDGFGFVLESGMVDDVILKGTGSLLKTSEGVAYLNGQSQYTGATVIAEGYLGVCADYGIPDASAVLLGEDAALDISYSHQVIGSLADYGDIGECDLGGYVDLEEGHLYTGYDNTDTTFTGVIYGGYVLSDELTSGIWKIGQGTWTLNGAIYGVDVVHNTSGTFIHNGEMDVLEVVNYEGAVFSGHGVIDAWQFVNHGTFAPGSDFGYSGIGIYGDFVQESSGNLVFRLRSAEDYNWLFVDGDVYLDGGLSFELLGEFTPSKADEFIVLGTFGEIEGDFSRVSVTGGRTMLRPHLSIRDLEIPDYGDGHDDDITILVAPDADPEPSVITGLVVSFEQESYGNIPGLTPNQRAVGRALDSAIRRGELGNLIDGLNGADYKDIPTALTLLSPEQLSAIFQIGFSNSRTQFTNIERRLEDARRGATGFSASGLALNGGPAVSGAEGLSLAGFDGKSLVDKNPVAHIVEESRWNFFITGSGEWADIESTREARGSEFSTGGITVGADYRVNNNLIVGVAGSYVHTGSDLWDGGRVKLDGGKGALYATLFNDNAWLNASVGGAYNSYDTRRSLVGAEARGRTHGGEFDALLGGGYAFNTPCGFQFGPVASLEYVYLGLNSFQETGSPAPLHFPSQHQESLRSALGVKASYDWSVGGVVVTPEVRVRWAHEYLDSTSAVVSRFVGASSTFRVHGPKIGRDSLLVDAGASVQINPFWAVYANYSSELFRTNYSSNTVSGGVRLSF